MNHYTLFNAQFGLKLKLIIILFVALSWCLAYYLNTWLFNRLEFNEDIISWVFLPAAVRFFAVLLAGWVGVFGLFLGSIVTSLWATSHDPALLHILVFATISSTAPMLALSVCIWGLKISNSFQGLNASNLLVLCAMSALFSAFPHNLAYYYFGQVVSLSEGMGPMFVGDFLGMLIVLYLVKFSLPKNVKSHDHTFS